MKKKYLILLAALFLNTNTSVILAASTQDNLRSLIKEKEIKEFKSNSEISYFWKASDICCDDDNNLYVADTGWNSIIKLTPNGDFIRTIGRQGQGPGEFLAGGASGRLKISYGRDKNIYVTDAGNLRITIFNRDGQYIRQMALPHYLYDKAIADSKSRIYLLSENQNNGRGICVYSPENKLMDCFFDLKLHFDAPFYKPPKEMKNINDSDIQKHLTRDDKIVVLSNVSLSVFVYDNKNLQLEKKIKIDDDRFTSDYKARLEAMISKTKRAFITPFESCLDRKNGLCLFYANDKNKCNEMYRYNLETGKLEDIYIFPERTGRICCITNHCCPK